MDDPEPGPGNIHQMLSWLLVNFDGGGSGIFVAGSPLDEEPKSWPCAEALGKFGVERLLLRSSQNSWTHRGPIRGMRSGCCRRVGAVTERSLMFPPFTEGVNAAGVSALVDLKQSVQATTMLEPGHLLVSREVSKHRSLLLTSEATSSSVARKAREAAGYGGGEMVDALGLASPFAMPRRIHSLGSDAGAGSPAGLVAA